MKEERPGTGAVGAAFTVGTLGAAVLLILPALLTSLTEQLHFDEKQLGVFSFADLSGLTLGSAFGAHFLPRVGIRRGTQFGLALAALANLASAALPSFPAFLALRISAGLGAGVALAAAYLVLGRSRHVDRNFSIFLLCQGLFGAVALKLFPSLTTAIGGTGGIFALLGALYAAAVLPALALPASRLSPGALAITGRAEPSAWIGLAGILVFFVAQGAVWAYLELMGTRAGVEARSVSTGVALSSLVGLSGPFIAAILGVRLGRLMPLCFGLALGLLALALLNSHLDDTRFAVAACLFNIAWNFSIPYQLSVLSTVDAAGTSVGWAASVSLAGLALGPPFAAMAHEVNGFSGVLGLSASLYAVSVGALLPALARGLRTPAPPAGNAGL